MKHRDVEGKLCERHPSVSEDRVLELAVLGSRTAGFHHDAASKLQSLLMALDEISELATDAQPDLRTAIDTAHGALRELHVLLNENRGLAKPPQRTLVVLGEVVARASGRVGVRVRGEITPADVRVAVPLITHAIELLIDHVGGPSRNGRIVDVAATIAGGRVRLSITGSPGEKPAARVGEVFSFAAYAIHRNDGELTCIGDDQVILDLPLGHPTTAQPPLAKP
jgi:hypothetical protein